jgi:hypothetical protein
VKDGLSKIKGENVRHIGNLYHSRCHLSCRLR